MRLLSIYIILELLLLSCDDKSNNTIIETPKTVEIFKLKVGNIWEYRNNKNEKLVFEISEKVDTNWIMKFYNTEPVKIKNTYICKVKKFVQGFPELSYFAIAETDSGLYLGTNNHILISDINNFPYFFNYIFLKKDLNKYPYTIETKIETTFDGKKDYLCDSLVMKNSGKNFVIDSIYNEFEVHLYSKRYPNFVKNKLQKWKFAFGFGFTEIEDYKLNSFVKGVK